MSKKVAVSKIVIEIGGEAKELTLEQAKELQSALNELFGKTIIVPSQPIIVDRYFERPRRYFRDWEVTWTTNGTYNNSGANLESGVLTLCASNSK